MNAYAERFVRSIKSECLDQMILLGREALIRAMTEYVAHYHDEHSHQGLGNEMIGRAKVQGEGVIEMEERLGGLLKYYYRGQLEMGNLNPIFGHYGVNHSPDRKRESPPRGSLSCITT